MASEIRSDIPTYELGPDQWRFLAEYLGNLGVTINGSTDNTEAREVLLARTNEQERYTGILVNQNDFVAFAASHNHTKQLAGRAWRALTRAYDHKVHADYWSSWPSLKGQDLSRIPLVFGREPTSSAYPRYHFRDELGDLHLDSLAAMLIMIDEDIEQYPDGIHRILGRNYGEGTLRFLRLYVDGAYEKADNANHAHSSAAPGPSGTTGYDA